MKLFCNNPTCENYHVAIEPMVALKRFPDTCVCGKCLDPLSHTLRYTNKDEYLNNITSVMLPALDYSNEIFENGAYLYVTDTDKAKQDFIKCMYQM